MEKSFGFSIFSSNFVQQKSWQTAPFLELMRNKISHNAWVFGDLHLSRLGGGIFLV